MKKVLFLLGLWVLLAHVEAAPPANQNGQGLASSNGAELVRGAWSGTLSLRLPGEAKRQRQITLWFNATAQDPQNPADSKASGYFSNDDVGGQKRAKAPALPMMARFVKSDKGRFDFDVDILATFQIPPDLGAGTIMMELTGKAVLRGSAVTDDTMKGTWSAMGYEGDWSAKHVDPRKVNTPTPDLSDPTLWFYADVYAGLEGPLDDPGRYRAKCLSASSNIVMAGVRVTYPDETTVDLPPVTDVWLFKVDWLAPFRFTAWLPGLPEAPGRYVFTALDVAGRPIPGVATSDVWVDVGSPNPPTNVCALVTPENVTPKGIMVAWDPVDDVDDSFKPGSGIGYYQISVCRVVEDLSWPLAYMAAGISTPSHLIPQYSGDFVQGEDWGLPLDGMEDGIYSLGVSVISLAPANSAGHGAEYHNADATTALWIKIDGDSVGLLPRQGSWQWAWLDDSPVSQWPPQ
jgi:hypothetical protein